MIKKIKLILKFILYSGIFIFLISFFQKNVLPGKNDIDENLFREPVQIKSEKPQFEIENNGIVYIIKPLYEYELHGLIVSGHNSSEWFDYYHDKWKDYINLKDICVIWGESAKNGSYEYFNFESGSWTCYFKSKPQVKPEEWSLLKPNEVSNNHLLSNDRDINKRILSAEKGDQIRLKGYLAEYSIKNEGFKRGTSISRTDSGNGACETIFLTDFEVIKKVNPFWRELYSISIYLIAGSFIVLSILFFKE